LKPFGVEDADFLLRWNNDLDYTGEFEPYEPVSRGELEEWLLRDKTDQLWYIIENTLGRMWGRLSEDARMMAQYR
jgi:hypothetical protein